MPNNRRRRIGWMGRAVLVLSLSLSASAGSDDNKQSQSPPSLWKDPGDLAQRDLIYGQGGEQRAPGPGPFVFVEEDLEGFTPKFIVRDNQGVLWKVKVGEEARPETVATRLLWAVGYTTDEDYFVPVLRVENMPTMLKRGGEFVSSDGSIHNARWERLDREKLDKWRWSKNPFSESKELDGLRVLMALLNNWDVKDTQNSIYQREANRDFVVSDLGATLGATGSRWPLRTKKGDLEKYGRTNFITKTTEEYVNFAAPSWPMIFGIIPTPPLPYSILTAPVKLFGRTPAANITSHRWIGKRIPRENVRWIAALLARLSPQQIRDAFRAAHYTPEEVEGFSLVVETRIQQLREL